MDFLEAAAVLVPALAGIEMTVYNGEPEVLTRFEQQYCFLRTAQQIYNASSLEAFLLSCEDNLIFDLEEPLGSRLAVFKVGDCWVMLGPYVEEGWNETAARILLTNLGASESVIKPYQTYRCKLPFVGRDYVIKAALLIAKRSNDESTVRKVKSIQMAPDKLDLAQTFPDAYHDISIINRRYDMEQRFITAINNGETETALKVMHSFNEVTPDLQFVSDDFKDQLVFAAIFRTMARMGGLQGGLSAVLVDEISQEYAQKMKHTTSFAELNYFLVQMVERFCSEVQALKQNHYSSFVRKAMDYMMVNLSQHLTVAEIAQAAGVNRCLLVKRFTQETGMTIKQYLAKQRCEIAAELLRDGRTSVQEVAAYVGYPDSNYFTKIFRANQGVTPQSYQKSHWSYK